jgi:branched-chain amino acid transport system permease protein
MIFLYYLILALALLTNAFVSRMRKLPIGRAWEAMREDEIACQAMGINASNVKLSAFAIGAMLGGFAGVFFAARQGFISPESFTFNESAIILAIVVLGGMGSQLGVVLASLVLVLLPELGRDFAEYRMLLFGAAMILIMVWKPGGILSHREPTLRLPRRRRPPMSAAPPPQRRAPDDALRRPHWRSTTCRSTSPAARSPASSDRTAPARPPSSTA